MGGRLLTLIASFFLFCALVAAAGCGGVGERSASGPYSGGSGTSSSRRYTVN